MPTLYLDAQGSRLGSAGGKLVLTRPDGNQTQFPIEQVDRLLAYGRVTLTPSALGALLDRGVSCTLLTSRGRLRGYLLAPGGGQVQRRARQYAIMQSEKKALALAQALVVAKLRNQHWLLRYWNVRRWGIRRGLRSHVTSARRQRTLDALRGVEGYGAREYFSCFPRALNGSAHEFPGRVKHPPTDPVNALLSLGYTLLLGEVLTAVTAHGLDPYAGVFHTSNGTQPSCALDLMEPLRPIVDRLVVRLARHAFSPEHFEVREGACLIASGRRGDFYQAWEGLLESRVHWRGEEQSYRRLLHAQARELAQHLDDPETNFRPFLWTEVGA